MKQFTLSITLIFFFYLPGMAQDSAYYIHHPDELRALLSKVENKERSSTVQPVSTKQRPRKFNNQVLTPYLYRPTRLGSSSPRYNTYIKNHYGAGAVTTNPNKWGSSAPDFQQYNAANLQIEAKIRPPKYNSQQLTPKLYRPTRLGSSSPKYDSYIKNSYGAGSVTTSPKHGGSTPPVIVPPQNKVPSPPENEVARDDPPSQKNNS